MMPHFEPTTGLLSYCSLDQFIQQHIKAATGDPSTEVIALRGEVIRVQGDFNRVAAAGQTRVNEYQSLALTHQGVVSQMQALKQANATASINATTYAKTIEALQAEVKAEQARANRQDRDAIKLANVEAELKNIKTVSDHRGVIISQLEAERDQGKCVIKTMEVRLAEAEQKAADAKSQPTFGQLSTRNSELETETRNLKYDLAVARSDLKKAKTQIAEYEAQSNRSLPGRLVTNNDPTVEQDDIVVIANLELEITSLKSDLEVCQAELEQAKTDLGAPWHGMALGVGGEGAEGEAVKARISSLQSTIDKLESSNADLSLELNNLKSEIEQKRVKEMSRQNHRETVKLQIQHSAIVNDITSPTPTSPTPTSPTLLPEIGHDDDMEAEIREDCDCDCGREEVIVEMASKSEVAFVAAMRFIGASRDAARETMDSAPLREKCEKVEVVRAIGDYQRLVGGLVEEARDVMAKRAKRAKRSL